MYLAGHESITRRNRRELCTLEEDLRYGQGHSEVVIRHVVFPIEDDEAALSWHLTQRRVANKRGAIQKARGALDDASTWFKAFEHVLQRPGADKDLSGLS